MPIELCLAWDGRKHWNRQKPRNMSLDEPKKTERNQTAEGKRGPPTRSQAPSPRRRHLKPSCYDVTPSRTYTEWKQGPYTARDSPDRAEAPLRDRPLGIISIRQRGGKETSLQVLKCSPLLLTPPHTRCS